MQLIENGVDELVGFALSPLRDDERRRRCFPWLFFAAHFLDDAAQKYERDVPDLTALRVEEIGENAL